VPLNGKKRPSEDQLDTVRNEAEAELQGKGRVVIRASGTEPIVRVMIQHDIQRTADTLCHQLAEKIRVM
jgi:phosphoglucosamine mutase